MNRFLLLVSFVIFMGLSFAGELPYGENPSKNLAIVKGDFEYADMPLKQVFDDIRNRASVNILANVDVDVKMPITISLHNVTAQVAFDEVMKAGKLYYRVERTNNEDIFGVILVYGTKAMAMQTSNKTQDTKPKTPATSGAKATQLALAKKFNADYSDVELKAILDDFFKKADIKYELAETITNAPAMTEKSSFSFYANDMTAEKALGWILRKGNLSYRIKDDGTILIQQKDADSAPVANINLFPTVRTGTAAQVRKEIDAGGNINAKDQYGSTLLFTAAEFNESIDVLQVLMKAGIDPKAKNTGGDTALHFAAQSNSNPEIIRALIKAGIDVNATDDDLRTPLFCAAVCNKNPKVLQLLIKLGADINFKTKTGLTPLMGAKRHKNEAAIKVLMKAGAKE